MTSIGSHPRRQGWRAVALVGALAVLALAGLAIARQAVTSDEAYHVLAGYQADRYGQNGLNLEHPPLLKMVAALPLLAAPRPLAPVTTVTPALTTLQAVYTQPRAEPLVRFGSRALVACAFGLPLLLVAFCLGRAVGGPAAGAVLALMLGLDFSVFPLLGMVYTDAAAALGFGLALLAAARFLRRPDLASAALAGLALGLALASKFTGLLALPVVAGAVLLAPRRQTAGPGSGPGGGPSNGPARGLARRLLCFAVALAIAWAAVELAYAAANRRYEAAYGRETLQLYAENRSTMLVDDRMRPFEPFLLAVERRDPRAAQWLTGLLATRAQNAIGTYPACNFGRMRSRGSWWYFPVLLLAKTPLAMLLASAAAVASGLLAARRRRGIARPGTPGMSAEAPDAQLPGVLGRATIAATSAPTVTPPSAATRTSAAIAATPASPTTPASPATTATADETARRRFALLLGSSAAIYLAAAMASNYNAGLRHLLPILPVVYLPAALWAARRPRVAAVLLAVLLIESLALAPVWVSSTNTWWLGARDPLRFALSTDNCFYPQNLIALRDVAERRSLRPLHLLDPSLGAPQVERYLGPGVSLVPESPLPAGWYAIGAAAEVCLPAIVRSSPGEMYGFSRYRAIAERWLPATTAVVRAGHDFGYAAGTFHLYRLAAPIPTPILAASIPAASLPAPMPAAAVPTAPRPSPIPAAPIPTAAVRAAAAPAAPLPAPIPAVSIPAAPLLATAATPHPR